MATKTTETKTEKKVQTPSLGRIVHFVDGEGYHNAAIISYVEFDNPDKDARVSRVDLHVFGRNGVKVIQDVPQSDLGGQPITWHWPEYVE